MLPLSLVASGEAADGVPATVEAPGVPLSDAVVSVEGSVAEVDEPQAASTMLTHNMTVMNIELRIESLLVDVVRCFEGCSPAAEYHSSGRCLWIARLISRRLYRRLLSADSMIGSGTGQYEQTFEHVRMTRPFCSPACNAAGGAFFPCAEIENGEVRLHQC
jgi:hypothetical protein